MKRTDNNHSESRSRNAVRNIYFGFLQKVVAMGCPFILRTVMLYYLGVEYIGLHSLFSSILQVLSLTELGFGAAMIFALYGPMSQKDKPAICALLNFYRKVYITVGTLMLIAGMAVVPFLRFIIKDGIPADVNLYVLYFIYLSNSVLSYFMFAYKQCLLTAAQRNDIISKRSTIVQLVSFSVQVYLICATRNYYAYVIIIPLASVLTNLSNAVICNRIFPDYKCEGEISSEIKKTMFRKTGALFGTKLNSIVLHTADTIALSSFIGLQAVAIYGNYYYIMNAIAGFLMIAYASITASVGNSIVTENIEKNYQDFQMIHFMNAWLVGWCSICLLCLYQPFMKIWLRDPGLLYPFGMVICFSLYFYFFQIRKVVITYKDAAGLWWEERYRPYIIMIINLLLDIVLVQIWSYYGVIIATVISMILSIPWENHTIFQYLFKRSSAYFYINNLKYLLTTLLAAVITYVLCAHVALDGWLELFARLLICLVMPNLLFVIFLHNTQGYKNSVKFVLKHMRNL